MLNAVEFLENNMDLVYAGIIAGKLELEGNPHPANDYSLDYVQLEGGENLAL